MLNGVHFQSTQFCLTLVQESLTHLKGGELIRVGLIEGFTVCRFPYRRIDLLLLQNCTWDAFHKVTNGVRSYRAAWSLTPLEMRSKALLESKIANPAAKPKVHLVCRSHSCWITGSRMCTRPIVFTMRTIGTRIQPSLTTVVPTKSLDLPRWQRSTARRVGD